MPVYEYFCEDCETVTEMEFNIKDMVREIDCPVCNKKAKKIISVPAKPGIIFYRADQKKVGGDK